MFAQTSTIDSLKKKIYSQPDKNKKLETIFLLCDNARALLPDTLLRYVTLAKNLVDKSNDKKDWFNVVYFKAIYFSKQSLTDSAEKLIDETLPQLVDPDLNLLKYKFLALKSNVLIKANLQKEAIENGLQVLHLAELSNDTLTQLRIKLTIGWAYMELDQNEEALKWFFDDIKLDNIVEEKYRQSVLYADIAAVYSELKKYDSAELFVNKAIDFSVRRNDFTTLANADNIYADICIAQNNNNKAEELLQAALKLRRQVGDPFFIISDIYQLGVFYAHNHQPDKGITIVKEGIALAEKENILEKLPILYQALAENYKDAGDLEKYSKTLSKIIVLKDSLYQKNSAEALTEMQTKYDVQKKENTIINQKLDLTRKNNLLFAAFMLLAIILVLGFVYFQNRKKNQQIKMQQVIFEQKKNIAAAVLVAGETERKRIAEDLHDSVAQKMVAAKLNLEAIEDYLPELNDEQQRVFNNIFSLVDESCTEVRNISHSMMPQAFIKSGLTDAVKDFIDKIGNKNLQINFSTEGDISIIDKDKELMIYRILQECIQNVLKHAKANNLDIAIIAAKDAIDITIEDNGIGFDVRMAEQTESIGLKNIQSRVDFLNGKLDIHSESGRGTIIAFYIPVT